MAKRINGRLARPYVKARTEFKNSNGQLYAEWLGEDLVGENNKMYVVYSYGPHWPLFVYVPHVNTWFENKDKYGPTTSKHRTQTHPHCETVSLTCDQIKLLERMGYNKLISERLNTNV